MERSRKNGTVIGAKEGPQNKGGWIWSAAAEYELPPLSSVEASEQKKRE